MHGPNIPGSYAILLFTTSNLVSITSPIYSFVLFLLWLHPFILSGVISPLISSSIIGTYWPGKFILQCPIILSFHTIHGVLEARTLKWFSIPFSSGPHSVRPLHQDRLGWPHMAWLSFIELFKAVICVIRLATCLQFSFSLSSLWCSLSTYHLTWFSLTLDVGYLFTVAPAKCSHCSLSWMWGSSSQPCSCTA